jgi:hypothetical protein
MTPKEDPWEEIAEPERDRYQALVDAFIPAVRLKPRDLWINFRAHHRIAILKPKHRGPHIARIELAIHYIWDAPGEKEIRALRSGWASSTVKRWLERFERHVRQWGPGDIELAKVTLQRQPTGIDLNLLAPSQFHIAEIQYRTGAHAEGVLGQAWKGNWDKLGNIQVYYKIPDAPFEVQGDRPVLTIDSYHHSFFKPGAAPAEALKWPHVVVPMSTYFPKKLWEDFQVVENNRGSEPWQVA